MSHESDQTPWHLLPHDPRGFFGIQDDDDYRALKRAYNKLLRRFKPEKFPEEFKRLRSAFESLSEELRYGATPSGSSPAWSVDIPEPDDPGKTTVEEQLRNAAPRELYEKLAVTEHRTPGEFVRLALLSDVVETNEEGCLKFWVLEGLKNHPRNPALTSLLREYLVAEVSVSACRELLIETTKVLPAGVFFQQTERAWDRLVRELPFEEVRTTLEQCIVNLGALLDQSRLIFFVHFLRAAVWKADDEWLRETWSELEEDYFSMPRWAQHEADLLGDLLAYREHRSDFVAYSSTSEQIDKAIEAYCLADESESDWAFVRCQYEIANRGLDLLDDLPTDIPSETARAVLRLWYRMSSDVNDRITVNNVEPDQEKLTAATSRMLYRSHIRHEKSTPYYRGLLGVLVTVALELCVLVAFVSLIIRSVGEFIEGEVGTGILTILLAMGVLVLVGGVLLVAGVLLFLNKLKLQYGDVRREAMKLFRVTTADLDDVCDAISACEDTEIEEKRIDDTEVVVKGMKNDLAMFFYSVALQTLAGSE